MRPVVTPPPRLGSPPCSCPGAPWDSIEPPPPTCARHPLAKDVTPIAEIRERHAYLPARGGSPDIATLLTHIAEQDDLMGRVSAEMGRLGTGIERVAAKYGAEHPEIAKALHDLLRGRD